MKENEGQPDRIMHPHEVAALAGVDAKTVTRWERAGKLESFRTLGGHRRYKEADVLAALGMAKTKAEDVGS